MKFARMAPVVEGARRNLLACCALALAAMMTGGVSAELISADAIAKQIAPADDRPTGKSLLASKAITFHVSPDAATRACEKLAPTVERRNLYVTNAPSIDLAVAFEFDSSRLQPAGKQQLDQLAAALRRDDLAKERFVIAGHTDAVGKTEYNDQLSCDRAIIVRNYLRDRHGIDAARLAVFGFGSSKLKDASQPASEVNRRTEVRLIPAGS